MGSIQVATTDERMKRVEQGEKFLTASRIADWEDLFKIGVHRMGRIVVTKDDKVATESWFGEKYKLGKILESNNQEITVIANPDYFAQVRTRDGQSRVSGINPPVASGWVYVNVLPFMIGSSMNFTNSLIAENLKSGNLRIHDYRRDGNKHIVELEYVEDRQRLIELIFDDDVSPLLPVETTFDKGVKHARRIISSDFRTVAGYKIPHKVEEMNEGHDVVTTEFFTEERLDPAMCRLTYYGLPEPVEMNVSDFGRKQSPWFLIVLFASGGVGVSILAYFLLRKRKS